MSFSVNGVTWIPQSASQHAQTQLTYLNSLNVAPTLVADPTNGIWLNFLGSGSIQQTYDDKLYAASQSFSVATCDDTQVLNLAPITGTSPAPATFSTVYLSVTAGSGGDAVIPDGTLAPFNVVNFVVDGPVTVPSGTTVTTIFAVCDTPGPILALAGQITSFSAPITNVQIVTNAANSTQGSNTESIASFRQRLIAGNGTIGWGLNGTILAVRALQGITNAIIYFNVSTSTNLTLPGSYTVAPRHAAILIMGSDVTGQLANTYMARMTAPTSGAYSENWISAAGQSVPVYYDIATNESVYVNIYYDPAQPVADNWLTLASAIIVGLNNTVSIGEEINQQLISQALSNFTYATITGITVSLDNITYSRNVVIDANKVANFATANIFQVTGP